MWLYVLIGYVLSTLGFGLAFSFGALFSEMLDKFQTDRTTTVAVQSLLMGVATCFSAVSGILIDRFGLHIPALLSSICLSTGFVLSFFITKIWYLYITLSVFAGIGMSLINVIAITIAATIRCQRQKSFGIALLSTNVPVAGLIYPHLLDFLTTAYGLSGTFLMLGGLFCNLFAFSLMIWLRHGQFIRYNGKTDTGLGEVNDKAEGVASCRGLQLCIDVKQYIKKLMTLRYICLIIATAFALSTSNGYLVFVFDISNWKGLNESLSRNVFIIYNIFRIFFSLIPAFIRQKLDIDMFYFPFCLALIGLSGSFIIKYSQTHIVYTIGTVCLSAVPGILSSSFIICSQLVHLEQISVALGLFNTVFGFLSAGIGPFFGFIRDSTGTYNNLFTIIAVAQGISALLFIGDIMLRKMYGKYQQSNFYEIEVEIQ